MTITTYDSRGDDGKQLFTGWFPDLPLQGEPANKPNEAPWTYISFRPEPKDGNTVEPAPPPPLLEVVTPFDGRLEIAYDSD